MRSKFIKIFFINVFLSVGLSGLVLANDLYTNPEKFKQYNPDGQKYEFVKTYIMGLGYLQQNAQRDNAARSAVFQKLKGKEKVAALIRNLNLNNVNLRVARNLVKKYRASGNGLVVKSADLFERVCDEQIELNNQEKTLLEKVSAVDNAQMMKIMNKKFYKDQRELGMQRKESLKKMLEGSMLMSKILISDKEDKYGELVRLGITSKERKKLIEQLDKLSKDKKVKPGQSFLQGSIAAIREILEDQSWGTVDG